MTQISPQVGQKRLSWITDAMVADVLATQRVRAFSTHNIEISVLQYSSFSFRRIYWMDYRLLVLFSYVLLPIVPYQCLQ